MFKTPQWSAADFNYLLFLTSPSLNELTNEAHVLGIDAGIATGVGRFQNDLRG